MAIDRAATLRNAEKFLRLGKLDLAIAEYLRIVEEQPRDWTTANTLGDLYLRAGQTDRAIEQFDRIADTLSREGFLPKAAAVYKKILKIRPDEERALVHAAELAVRQGLFADARAYFATVAERRVARGDRRGAAEMRIRIGALDRSDFDSRRAAVRARLDIADHAGAVSDLKALAAALDEAERADEALEARREAARLDPFDAALVAAVARAYTTRGDLAAAAEVLTPDAIAADPQLALTAAELRFRGGDVEAGIALLRGAIEADPSQAEAVAAIGWAVGEEAPDAGFRIVALAADHAVAAGDWDPAVAMLDEFVTRVPGHVPSLMRLIEICVDAGLDGALSAAQAQLADAYLASGAAAEARVIADDLVAREPWDAAHVDRYRRALALLGEPDPDAMIAERLSARSPSAPLDLERASAPPSVEPDAVAPAPPAPMRPLDIAAAPVQDDDGTWSYEIDSSPIDLERLLYELDPPDPETTASVEVDLSPALDGIRRGPLPVSAPSRVAPRATDRPVDPAPPIAADNLDEVFEQLRHEAARLAPDDADEQYQRGLQALEAGRIDVSLRAFEAAARAPRLRFAAAALAARLYRDQGALQQAVEWFERAAQAPAPTVDEGHAVFYELADALESAGEVARALAVCLELQAQAGSYRDVAARIDRLARAQARG